MSHSLYHFEDAGSQAAAERWRVLLQDPDRPFTVALSGGRIPKALYKAFAILAAGDSRGRAFFWGDERAVPPCRVVSGVEDS